MASNSFFEEDDNEDEDEDEEEEEAEKTSERIRNLHDDTSTPQRTFRPRKPPPASIPRPASPIEIPNKFKLGDIVRNVGSKLKFTLGEVTNETPAMVTIVEVDEKDMTRKRNMTQKRGDMLAKPNVEYTLAKRNVELVEGLKIDRANEKKKYNKEYNEERHKLTAEANRLFAQDAAKKRHEVRAIQILAGLARSQKQKGQLFAEAAEHERKAMQILAELARSQKQKDQLFAEAEAEAEEHERKDRRIKRRFTRSKRRICREL